MGWPNKIDGNTRIVTIKIPASYVNALDTLVDMGLYPSRSEAIREAIRKLLLEKLGSTWMEKTNRSKRKIYSVETEAIDLSPA